MKITQIFLLINFTYIFCCDIFIFSKHHKFILFISRFITFLSIYLIVSTKVKSRVGKSIILSLLYIFIGAEVSSYYTTEKSFSYQYIQSVSSLNAILADGAARPIFFLACIGIFIVFLMTSVTSIQLFIPNKILFYFVLLISIAAFPYMMSIKRDLMPFDDEIIQKNNEPEFVMRVDDYFYSNLTAKFRHPKRKPKNLIVFILESFELKNLGTYNDQYKHLMPFLSSLAANTTIFTNNVQEPFTGWSIASFVCTMCGIPMIKDGRRSDQGHFHMNNNVKCVSDFLNYLGYKTMVVKAGRPRIGKFPQFVWKHHFELYNRLVHQCTSDSCVSDWIINHLIPNVLKNSTQPFFLVWPTVATHFGSHSFPNQCNRKNVENYNGYFNEMECVDQYLKDIFAALEKYDLMKNTEIVIWGDHLSMGKNYIGDYRPLAIIVPTQHYGEIKFPTSYYDIQPMIFDLLDIDYSPHFMFGMNPLKPNYFRRRPLTLHLSYLFKHFQEQMKFDNISNDYFRSEDD